MRQTRAAPSLHLLSPGAAQECAAAAPPELQRRRARKVTRSRLHSVRVRDPPRGSRRSAAVRAAHTGDDDLDLDLTRSVFEFPVAAESSSLHLYIFFGGAKGGGGGGGGGGRGDDLHLTKTGEKRILQRSKEEKIWIALAEEDCYL